MARRRKKSSKTIEIAAPPAKVWAVVGDFQDMGWLPRRKDGRAGRRHAGNRQAQAVPAGGGVIDERLVQYDDAAMSLRISSNTLISLFFGRQSFRDAKGSPAPPAARSSNGKAGLSRFSRRQSAEQYTDEVAIKAVSELFRSGLAALKARVERE